MNRTARLPVTEPIRRLWRSGISAVLAALYLLSAGGLCSPAQAEPCDRYQPISLADPYTPLVAEASDRFDIPVPLLRAMIRIESRGSTAAVSPKGAMGLMQIMPDTWTDLRNRYRFGADPFDARENILAGAAYLRELHDRYGGMGALAAYNAGPARYEAYLTTGRSLPKETLDYIGALTSPAIIGLAEISLAGSSGRCGGFSMPAAFTLPSADPGSYASPGSRLLPEPVAYSGYRPAPARGHAPDDIVTQPGSAAWTASPLFVTADEGHGATAAGVAHARSSGHGEDLVSSGFEPQSAALFVPLPPRNASP